MIGALKKTWVGSTVNVAGATYPNNIGAADLRTVWKDPDFKPNRRGLVAIAGPSPRLAIRPSSSYGC